MNSPHYSAVSCSETLIPGSHVGVNQHKPSAHTPFHIKSTLLNCWHTLATLVSRQDNVWMFTTTTQTLSGNNLKNASQSWRCPPGLRVPQIWKRTELRGIHGVLLAWGGLLCLFYGSKNTHMSSRSGFPSITLCCSYDPCQSGGLMMLPDNVWSVSSH